MSVTPYASSSEKAHILVVDDEPSVRFFLAEELREHGYKVTALGSGEEALVWLRQHQTDVIVLDLKMVGMDGLQVMADVQSLPLPPVVIMLTAHGSLDAAVAAMRRGAYDFLRKPCSPEELLAAVERGLTRRRLCAGCWQGSQGRLAPAPPSGRARPFAGPGTADGHLAWGAVDSIAHRVPPAGLPDGAAR
jgi:DNA-binding NtrC family response regulator